MSIYFLASLKADNGGMVSPSGLSYIGRSKELLGDIPAAIACKRIHLDEAIAMAAKRWEYYGFFCPILSVSYYRVPTRPGNLEFYQIRKCPGKNIACEKNLLRKKKQLINIMPVEENFNCKRKRVSGHIPC